MHYLSQSVLTYIRKQDLLRPGDRVSVAVSGGADSVALLRLLLELRSELGVVLSVVHLNHCLRGAESDDDEQFVRELSTRFDLPFFSVRRDVQAYAAEKKISIETAARDLRYEYFEELLRKGEFNKLATAHTLDDQAETVLLKLTRGAGTRGLAGTYPKVLVGPSKEQRSPHRQLAIVRPLLSIERQDLERYLAQIHQLWREDSTNAQLHHTRNRIRHEILPRLCTEVNPQVRRTLAEVAEISRAEEEYWRSEVQRHLSTAWSSKEDGGILRNSTLHEFPLALRRRLIRAAAESLGLSLEFNHVEEILTISPNARSVLPGGWIARSVRDCIYFERSPPAAIQNYESQLQVPGHVEIPQAGVAIAAEILAPPRCRSYQPEHLLDSRFAEHLLVRNWRAGDRFWPAHSKESKKIKALLQDRHVTGDEKRAWPVIASGEDVVWLRGFGVGCQYLSRNGEGVLIRDEPLNKKDQPHTKN